MNMNRQDYITQFKASIANYKGIADGDYTIDNNFRYDNRQKTKIEIDKCLKIMDIRQEAIEWLHNLTIGQIITINAYFDTSDKTISKISYKKKINGKDISSMNLISSITSSDGRKYEPQDIMYKANRIEDIVNSYRHCKPTGYAFINEYDIRDINKIIENYKI